MNAQWASQQSPNTITIPSGIGAQIGAPPPQSAETVASRLENTFGTLIDCHKLVSEIEGALGIGVPTAAEAKDNAPGIHGATMAVRSSAMEMRERLGRVLGALR